MLTDHDLSRLRNAANRSSESVELHPLELQRLIGEIYTLRSEIAINDHLYASMRPMELSTS